MDRSDELRQRLMLAERLVRVDTALAKRVDDHIARDSELRGWLDNWIKAYPLDAFPEPDWIEAAKLLRWTPSVPAICGTS